MSTSPAPRPATDGDAAGDRPVDRGAEGKLAPHQSLLSRLVGPRVAILFARNTIVSCGVFAFDLMLLWMLVRFLGIDKYVAATIGFVAANSIHYVLCRLWIFVGSSRGLGAGYVYFFVNAGVGLVLTIALFALFTEVAGLQYIAARVVASVFAGLAVFLLNAVLNFKSV